MTDPTPHRAPRGLIVVLGVLIVVGVASLFFSALQYQAQQSASRASVDRNAQLTYEVHLGVYEVCLKAVEIAERAGIPVSPCEKPEPLDLEEAP